MVLLDLMMPVMTGWELLEKWEAQGRIAPERVCVISAFADQAPSTVQHVFGKPFDLDRLLQTVKALC